jgi:glycosyltransferase involved in cell wall biosynthesis
MRNIKVSVIIPVYSVEEYLPRLLDSLVNQTLRDIEIICADDHSKDNSLAILREYERKDIRVAKSYECKANIEQPFIINCKKSNYRQCHQHHADNKEFEVVKFCKDNTARKATEQAEQKINARSNARATKDTSSFESHSSYAFY